MGFLSDRPPGIGNIAMMGMGEPLANYENTVNPSGVFTPDFGPGMSDRRANVPTCGLAPQLLQPGEDICSNLAIFLNAHDDETRSLLMPINKQHPLARLLEVRKKYPIPGWWMLIGEHILIDDAKASCVDAEKPVA